MRRSVLGGAGLLAALAMGGHSAQAEASPATLEIAAFDAQSCVSEPEVRAALQQAGVLIAAAGGAGTTRVEVVGTPEQLSVQLRGSERAGSTLLPPATCATATDVVAAFLVSTLAPASPTPTPPAPALDAATLTARVHAELARRNIQLALEHVTLSLERDGSGTWFARIARAEDASVNQTIALGNFDDPSAPRITIVTDTIAHAVRRLSAVRHEPDPQQLALSRALERVDGNLPVTALGIGEVALGTSVLIFLAGGRAPNLHFSFGTAEDAFVSASASVAVLGGGASFFVPEDYRRAVIGVSGYAAIGGIYSALTLSAEHEVPAYSTAAVAAGSYGTAALLGLNAFLRLPPIGRLRAARAKLRGRAATPNEIREVEADLAATEPALPAWLTYLPLIAGGLVSTLPAIADGFSNDERRSVAIGGGVLAGIGLVEALSPSNYSRYQRERGPAGVTDLAFGVLPGARPGISLSGRF